MVNIAMDVEKTIKNIRSKCDGYIDPNLLSTIINKNYTMGRDILKVSDYGVKKEDTYEERFIKILEHENIFINCGMISFIPIVNECDVYSFEDESFKISEKEFMENYPKHEGYFGFLIGEDIDEYIIGIIDLCSCSIDSGFTPIKKSEKGLYEKLNTIIKREIIF